MKVSQIHCIDNKMSLGDLRRVAVTLGRMAPSKQMNFQKIPKGGGGVIFNAKIYIAKFGPLNRAFFSMKMIQKGLFRVCCQPYYHVELFPVSAPSGDANKRSVPGFQIFSTLRIYLK